MMGKDSTTSQLDFLLLEEVSNEAAEAISGGQTFTLGGEQEIEIGLFDPLTMPFDMLTSVIGSVSELTEALGIGVPPIGDLVGAIPLPDLPDLLPTNG